MIIATHILVATALTRRFAATQPLLAFLLAIASHYLLDALPHWAYKIASLKDKNPNNKYWRFTEKSIIHDLTRASIDAAAGLGLAFYIIQPPTGKDTAILLLVALGSILPDIFQSLYFAFTPEASILPWKFTRKFKFLKPLQEFHERFHTKIKLDPYPWLGIPAQVIFIFIVILLT